MRGGQLPTLGKGELNVLGVPKLKGWISKAKAGGKWCGAEAEKGSLRSF